jgi:FixJ family two-component response regulator
MSLPNVAFVVDDDPAMRDAMQGYLRLMGIPVGLFESAEEFLNAYQPDWTGVLFVDLRMPGMSGVELLEELARRQTRLQIVLITGHGSKESDERALELGARAILNKPFSIKQLEDALRSE